MLLFRKNIYDFVQNFDDCVKTNGKKYVIIVSKVAFSDATKKLL